MHIQGQLKPHARDASSPRRLNVMEAADYTGISVSTLNKCRVYGTGSVYQKIGRRVVYSPADLDAWMDAKRRISTSDAGTGK